MTMKKDKRGKKIFIYTSMLLIVFFSIFYGSRLVYYYLKEKAVDNNTGSGSYFADKLSRTINVSDASGGLYIYGDEYLYKYNATDNYLWYSGNLWRIIKINEDKTMDLVMDENLSILNSKYEDNDYINEYLEEFYEKLDKEYLVSLDYCNDLYDTVDDIKCDSKKQASITLLDIYTYNEAGGNGSFLNNSTNNYLINKNSNGNYWYLTKEGALSISDDVNSFGIRPVVRIKSDINLISGDGSIDNPYIIKENSTTNIGDYVLFDNSLWRVIDNNDGITILKEDALKKSIFGSTNVFSESELYSSLNEYYTNIDDSSYIIDTNFYKGVFKDYDYKSAREEIISLKVGIPKIADYYIYNKINSYLITTDEIEAIYSINENNNYYLTLPSNELDIYPIVTIKANLEGSGTKLNPYKVGEL